MARGEQVLYVAPGASPGGFGANKSAERVKMVGAGLMMAMAVSMLVSAALEEPRVVGYNPRSDWIAMLQHSDSVSDLVTSLARQELNAKLVGRMDQGLSQDELKMATNLVASAHSQTQNLVACSNIDKLKAVKAHFLELALNISAENATLFETKEALEKKNEEAERKWMDSESKYRSAEASYSTAKSATKYAQGEYTKFSVAVTEGEKQYAEDAVKYDTERTQLLNEKPALQELLTLVKTLGSASASAESKSILSTIKAKAQDLVAPSTAPSFAKSVHQLKTKLTEDSGMTGVVELVTKMITSIDTRVAEIDSAKAAQLAALNENKEKLKQWEEKMVDVAEAEDNAKNDMNTEDLQRQSLGGTALVLKQSYENFCGTFEEDVAKFQKEVDTIGAIAEKIELSISTCT